jgi:glycosyltransferase involved in cell wall biosynthesis
MKPRVLVMTTYYHPVLGGVETHTRQLVRHLHHRGFEVQVVTKRIDGQQPARDVVDEVTVHRVRPTGQRRRMGKWTALPFFFSKALRLRSSYDVIVCVDYRGIGMAAVAAGHLLRRRVIAQAGTMGVIAPPRRSSGIQIEGRVMRILKSFPRFVYRRADQFICVARDIEREAHVAGIPHKRVHYLPHGVDLERFRPPQDGERDAIREQLGWPADRTIVLFVGRLSTEKGVMDLLEAWRHMARADALLVLVGPDMPSHPWNAGPEARAYVEEHGLADRVRFEGPAEDTAPYYRGADIFVQPSHFEAFGISAIEAMASGLAVVVSEVGGLRDFLKPGKNGMGHQPRDAASLASALTELFDMPELRPKLGAAAAATVARHFDERVLFDRYAALIEATVRAA